MLSYSLTGNICLCSNRGFYKQNDDGKKIIKYNFKVFLIHSLSSNELVMYLK